MKLGEWVFAKYNGEAIGVEDTDFAWMNSNSDKVVDRSALIAATIAPSILGLPAAAQLFAPYERFENTPVNWLTGSTVKANNTTFSDCRIINTYDIVASATSVTVRYDVCYSTPNDVKLRGFSAITEILIVQNIKPSAPWNAKTMIERLLIRAETLRKSESPRFHLNATQAAEFEKIKIPEMHFSNSTLREALQTIGSFIHGEPRLKGKEISFDMYGGDEKTDVDFTEYAAKSYQRSIDNAVTSIDSTVDNLVSTTGYAQGVTVEPYAGGYKTVRTETLYDRINEDNMLISVQFGINRIIKLECGFVGSQVDASNLPIDITPYVFEESDYVRMSSYSGVYPNSRAYAIYYTQGGTTIQGLNYKQEEPIATAFGNYAIVNILRAATGNTELTVPDYPLLAFRVTYESITSARVKQNKQYILGATEQTEIAYNQGQNLIESGYYGENLKGVVARLGNVDKVITLYQRGTPKIPKVGTLFDDDYYISSTAVELLPYVTKISCALSKDFNRYSDYISVNSTRRFYEISERQAYDSYINYRDYVVIGDSFIGTSPAPPLVKMNDIIKTFNPTPEDKIVQETVPSEVKIVLDDGTEAAVGSQTAKKLIVQATGVASGEQVYLQLSYTYENVLSGRTFTGGFSGTTTLPYTKNLAEDGANLQFTVDSTATATVTRSVYKEGVATPPITAVRATSKNTDNGEIAKVVLPVKAMPLGNAAVFTFKYKDNYSAGDQAVWSASGEVSGYFQNGVAYKDYYGNIEYLGLQYYSELTSPSTAEQQKNIGLALPGIVYEKSDGDKSGFPEGAFSNPVMSTGVDPLHVKIGNTEVPTITYQIEFVTNRKDIIVGSGLARNLPLVSGEQGGKTAKLYVLPKRVNKFSQTIDLTGATLINANVYSIINIVGAAYFTSQTSTVSGAAWAIAVPDKDPTTGEDLTTGELLIAENKAITGDGTADILGNLQLTLTHNIYKR